MSDRTWINVDDDLQAFITATNTRLNTLVPKGTIVPFGGSHEDSPPAGWLFCHGQLVPKAKYQALYKVINSHFGSDGNEFRVPDLRGRFVRGVDLGAGNDPDSTKRVSSNPNGRIGNFVGSKQDEQFKNHNHNHIVGGKGGEAGNYAELLRYQRGKEAEAYRGNTAGNQLVNLRWHATIKATGGSETRPKNIYVNFIIRAE